MIFPLMTPNSCTPSYMPKFMLFISFKTIKRSKKYLQDTKKQESKQTKTNKTKM